MPPTFKKPLEYDSSLANATLNRLHQATPEGQRLKAQNMLAELGLADEGMDVEDDEDEGSMNSEDEQPILRNGGQAANGAGAGNGALATYGYKDVFGKEYERRRAQTIEKKGYDRYLQDMLERSAEALQLLRSDKNLQYPGSVEIIGELEHELGHLSGENKQLRHETAQLRNELETAAPSGAGARSNGAAASSRGVSAAAGGRVDQDLKEVSGKIAALELQLSQRDVTIRDLQAQLKHASSRTTAIASTGGAAAASATQLEQLQSALSKKESQLAATSEQLRMLQEGSAEKELSKALTAARNLADEASQRSETLRQQLAASQEELRAKEKDFEARIKELSSVADNEQAAVLQKNVWLLTEQHARRVEELEADIKQKQVMIKQLQSQKADAITKCDAALAQVKTAESSAAQAVKAKVEKLHKTIDELHSFREAVLAELLSMQKDLFNNSKLAEMGRSFRDKELEVIKRVRGDMQGELDAALARIASAEEAVEHTKRAAEETIRIKAMEAEGQVTFYKDKWRQEFDRRRKLHNQVIELKGAIRVLCRVRPLLDKESHGAEEPVKVLTEEIIRVSTDRGQDKEFEFDRVFAPKDGQPVVFDEVSALVTSVLDGFNVSIMAYGQTGSGKTHTMEGPEQDPGVNMRALQTLFDLAADRKEDWDYNFSASVLEIYNENIYDLLQAGKQADDKLDVKQSSDGMYVPGLMSEPVAGMEDVRAIINRGKKNRSTYATNMNEHSSRSHLVLSVYITGSNRRAGTSMKAKLHLIDLAGSERIARTGAQGDRLKEAQNINRSLSALGDVIQALQQKNAHIPYRNSKLTRLLEDSLGGNAKCIMVVNVSPALENTSETKCSLEFASRARKVELGKATANVTRGGGNTPGSNTPGGSTPRR